MRFEMMTWPNHDQVTKSLNIKKYIKNHALQVGDLRLPAKIVTKIYCLKISAVNARYSIGYNFPIKWRHRPDRCRKSELNRAQINSPKFDPLYYTHLFFRE